MQNTSSPLQRILLLLLVAIGGYLAVLLFMWLLVGASVLGSQRHFLRALVSHGEMNTWLARSISLLFAAATGFGCRNLLSFTASTRRNGALILFSVLIGFNLTVYAVAPVPAIHPNARVPEAPLFDNLGNPLYRYHVDDHHSWHIFPRHIEYHPTTGDPMPLLTYDAVKRYSAWQRLTADRDRKDRELESSRKATLNAQRDAQKQAASRRELQDALVNVDALAAAPPRSLVLAVQCDGCTAAQRDVVQEQLSKTLQQSGWTVLPTLLKPKFYNAGHFEAAWNGDRSILEAIDLKRHVSSVLLCKVSFSEPMPTDFEGFVHVHGELSAYLIMDDGEIGPRTVIAAGAGANTASAVREAAKRIVNSLDISR